MVIKSVQRTQDISSATAKDSRESDLSIKALGGLRKKRELQAAELRRRQEAEKISKESLRKDSLAAQSKENQEFLQLVKDRPKTNLPYEQRVTELNNWIERNKSKLSDSRFKDKVVKLIQSEERGLDRLNRQEVQQVINKLENIGKDKTYDEYKQEVESIVQENLGTISRSKENIKELQGELGSQQEVLANITVQELQKDLGTIDKEKSYDAQYAQLVNIVEQRKSLIDPTKITDATGLVESEQARLAEVSAKEYDQAVSTFKPTGSYEEQLNQLSSFVDTNKDILAREGNFARYETWLEQQKEKIESKNIEEFNKANQALKLSGDYQTQVQQYNDWVKANESVLARGDNYDKFLELASAKETEFDRLNQQELQKVIAPVNQETDVLKAYDKINQLFESEENKAILGRGDNYDFTQEWLKTKEQELKSKGQQVFEETKGTLKLEGDYVTQMNKLNDWVETNQNKLSLAPSVEDANAFITEQFTKIQDADNKLFESAVGKLDPTNTLLQEAKSGNLKVELKPGEYTGTFVEELNKINKWATENKDIFTRDEERANVYNTILENKKAELDIYKNQRLDQALSLKPSTSNKTLEAYDKEVKDWISKFDVLTLSDQFDKTNKLLQADYTAISSKEAEKKQVEYDKKTKTPGGISLYDLKNSSKYEREYYADGSLKRVYLPEEKYYEQYVPSYDGKSWTKVGNSKDTFIPYEIEFYSSGAVKKEAARDKYLSDAEKDLREYGTYKKYLYEFDSSGNVKQAQQQQIVKIGTQGGVSIYRPNDVKVIAEELQKKAEYIQGVYDAGSSLSSYDLFDLLDTDKDGKISLLESSTQDLIKQAATLDQQQKSKKELEDARNALYSDFQTSLGTTGKYSSYDLMDSLGYTKEKGVSMDFSAQLKSDIENITQQKAEYDKLKSEISGKIDQSIATTSVQDKLSYLDEDLRSSIPKNIDASNISKTQLDEINKLYGLQKTKDLAFTYSLSEKDLEKKGIELEKKIDDYNLGKLDKGTDLSKEIEQFNKESQKVNLLQAAVSAEQFDVVKQIEQSNKEKQNIVSNLSDVETKLSTVRADTKGFSPEDYVSYKGDLEKEATKLREQYIQKVDIWGETFKDRTTIKEQAKQAYIDAGGKGLGAVGAVIKTYASGFGEGMSQDFEMLGNVFTKGDARLSTAKEQEAKYLSEFDNGFADGANKLSEKWEVISRADLGESTKLAGDNWLLGAGIGFVGGLSKGVQGIGTGLVKVGEGAKFMEAQYDNTNLPQPLESFGKVGYGFLGDVLTGGGEYLQERPGQFLIELGSSAVISGVAFGALKGVATARKAATLAKPTTAIGQGLKTTGVLSAKGIEKTAIFLGTADDYLELGLAPILAPEGKKSEAFGQALVSVGAGEAGARIGVKAYQQADVLRSQQGILSPAVLETKSLLRAKTTDVSLKDMGFKWTPDVKQVGPIKQTRNIPKESARTIVDDLFSGKVDTPDGIKYGKASEFSREGQIKATEKIQELGGPLKVAEIGFKPIDEILPKIRYESSFDLKGKQLGVKEFDKPSIDLSAKEKSFFRGEVTKDLTGKIEEVKMPELVTKVTPEGEFGLSELDFKDLPFGPPTRIGEVQFKTSEGEFKIQDIDKGKLITKLDKGEFKFESFDWGKSPSDVFSTSKKLPPLKTEPTVTLETAEGKMVFTKQELLDAGIDKLKADKLISRPFETSRELTITEQNLLSGKIKGKGALAQGAESKFKVTDFYGQELRIDAPRSIEAQQKFRPAEKVNDFELEIIRPKSEGVLERFSPDRPEVMKLKDATGEKISDEFLLSKEGEASIDYFGRKTETGYYTNREGTRVIENLRDSGYEIKGEYIYDPSGKLVFKGKVTDPAFKSTILRLGFGPDVSVKQDFLRNIEVDLRSISQREQPLLSKGKGKVKDFPSMKIKQLDLAMKIRDAIRAEVKAEDLKEIKAIDNTGYNKLLQAINAESNLKTIPVSKSRTTLAQLETRTKLTQEQDLLSQYQKPFVSQRNIDFNLKTPDFELSHTKPTKTTQVKSVQKAALIKGPYYTQMASSKSMPAYQIPPSELVSFKPQKEVRINQVAETQPIFQDYISKGDLKTNQYSDLFYAKKTELFPPESRIDQIKTARLRETQIKSQALDTELNLRETQRLDQVTRTSQEQYLRDLQKQRQQQTQRFTQDFKQDLSQDYDLRQTNKLQDIKFDPSFKGIEIKSFKSPRFSPEIKAPEYKPFELDFPQYKPEKQKKVPPKPKPKKDKYAERQFRVLDLVNVNKKSNPPKSLKRSGLLW